MVNRYDPLQPSLEDGSAVMEVSSYGDYVTYEDYEEMKRDRDDLRIQLQRIGKKVKDLAWEF